MKATNLISAACAVGFLAMSQHGVANPTTESTKQLVDGSVRMLSGMELPKAASAQTIASRAMVTSSATLFGGFQLAAPAVVYILVRGNSLGTLNVTQNYLDAPRVRLFNSQNQDLIVDGAGIPGFNSCLSSNTTTDRPVLDYYQFTRGQPAHSRDACFAANFSAGTYTFTVTPSIPGVTTTSMASSPTFGEVLFEVTLGP